MEKDILLHANTVNQVACINYNKDKFQTLLISQKEGVKTILFAFSSSQELKSHTAPVEVVVVPVEGQAIFTHEKEEMIIKPGDVLKIAAHARHAVKAITDFKMLLIK